jgi:spore germination cell wall hydrolase CwlJ-like protein
MLDQENDPSEISGINKGSLSAALFGSAPEKTNDSARASLSSMVLSSHLSADELGKFDIRYELTPEEYQMLLYCVDFETRSGSLEHKMLIAQVVMNRVQGERFAFTVEEVLMAPNQFDVMPFFESRGDWTPTDVTVQAVNSVLSGESPDYAQGALYFCNPYLVGEDNWFDASLQVVCEIEGHRFYKR